MAFTMVTLTAGGGYRTALGDVPLTRIRATPYVEMTNGTRTVAQEVVLPVAANGATTRTLAATTDPGTLPVGNAYAFVIEADGRPVRQFIAAVPHNAGSSVSIDSLTPLAEPPDLAALGAVSSVNGQTGTVVLTAAGLGAQAADADLTALAGLGDGVPVRTAGTWAATDPAAFSASRALAYALIFGGA